MTPDINAMIEAATGEFTFDGRFSKYAAKPQPDPGRRREGANERETMIDARVWLEWHNTGGFPPHNSLSDAERDVDSYLLRKPRPWHPGMVMFVNDIPDFVRYPVMWRGNPPGQRLCEDCKQPGDLVIHHLHYHSVGCELPSDLAHLCRRKDGCHHYRHYRGGFVWNLDRTPQALAAAERSLGHQERKKGPE